MGRPSARFPKFRSSRPGFPRLGRLGQVSRVSVRFPCYRSSRPSRPSLGQPGGSRSGRPGVGLGQVSRVSTRLPRSRSSRPSLSGLGQVSLVSVVSAKSLRSWLGRPGLGQPGGSRLGRPGVGLGQFSRVSARLPRSRSSRPSLSGLNQVSLVLVVSTKSLRS